MFQSLPDRKNFVRNQILPIFDKYKLSSGTAKLVNLVENLYLSYFQLRKCESNMDFFHVFINFLKLETGITILDPSNIGIIMEFIDNDLFSDLPSDDSNDKIKLQSTEFIRDARKHFDNFTVLKNTIFFKKMYKFFVFSICYSLFGWVNKSAEMCGFTRIEAELKRKKMFSTTSLLECLVDTTLFIAESGYDIMENGINAIYHTGSAYSRWFDEVESIRTDSIKFENPGAFPDFDPHTYQGRLKEAIEKGKCIRDNCKHMDSPEFKAVVFKLAELNYRNDNMLTLKYACSERQTPYGLLIYGPSCVGKSTLVDLVYAHFGKIRGKNIESQYKYTHSCKAKYWDNFSSEMWCVVLDDIAAANPDSCPNDESVDEILQIVNGIPYVPDQAAIEKKGKTPLRADLVIATTNTKDLNAHVYYAVPSAVQRRLKHVVTMTVKEEYARNGILDRSRIPPHKMLEEYPDFWNFHIQVVDVISTSNMDEFPSIKNRNCSYSEYFPPSYDHKGREIATQVGIKGFVQFLNSTVTAHFENQQVMTDSITRLREVELCACNLPYTLCTICHKEEKSEETDMSETIDPSVHDCIIQKQSVPVSTVFDFTSFLLLVSTLLSFTNSLMMYVATYRIGYIFSFFTRRCIKINNWFYFRLQHYLFMKRKIKNYPREFFARMGIHFEVDSKKPLFLLSLSLVGIAYIVYKVVRMSKIFGQSFGAPHPKDESDNPYSHDVVTELDIPLKSKCSTNSDILEKFKRNTVFMQTEYQENGESMILKCRALCLRGNTYLMNNHCLLDGASYIVTSSYGVVSKVMRIGSLDVVRNVKHDLAIVRLKSMPPRTSLLDYIVAEKHDIGEKAVYIDVDESGASDCYTLARLQKITPNSFKDVPFPSVCGIGPKTENGHCGMPLLTEHPQGLALCGIHAYAATNLFGTNFRVGAATLNHEVISEMLEMMDVDVILDGSTPNLDPVDSQCNTNITTLHHKSPFWWIPGEYDVHGSFGTAEQHAFRMTPVSHVVPTLLNPILSGLSVPDEYTAPHMKGWKAKSLALEDLKQPVTMLDPDIVSLCKGSFLQDITSGLKRQWSLIEPYDHLTTINGADGVAFVDRMKISTSMGFPWKKKKSHYMLDVPSTHLHDVARTFTPEVMERIENLRAKYIAGERGCAIFNACLKDEPVTHIKAEKGKTRVFMSAPIELSYLCRQYFLSLVRVIQRNSFLFEASPGINCNSKRWTKLREHLTSFGESRIVAGDYRAFDKTMPPLLMSAAFEILIELAEMSGNYSQNDLKVMRGVATDIIFPYCDYFGDLVQFHGSNPSGHPLTVIINGICNSLYMRYCYVDLNPEGEVHTFKENVHLTTYGDDNIMGVSENAQFFNHTSISNSLDKVGVTYTMADKEAESVPYIHIDEASFLKRKWRWDDRTKSYLAPLEASSIWKMLMKQVRSKTITTEQQMMESITSAYSESFHHGQIFQDMLRNKLRRAIELYDESDDDHHLHMWISESTFPSTEEFINRHKGLYTNQ